MLGLPGSFTCPTCEASVPTYFDDYDIDSEPYDKGVWTLFLYCSECETEFTGEARLNVSFKILGA